VQLNGATEKGRIYRYNSEVYALIIRGLYQEFLLFIIKLSKF